MSAAKQSFAMRLAQLQELPLAHLTGREISTIIGIGRSRTLELLRRSGLKCKRPPNVGGRGVLSSFWSAPERTEFVLAHWERHSAAWIAARLGITKNAVIGRVNRLGATKRPLPVRSPPTPQMTDADSRGCRFIAGDPRDLHPGMFCGKPVVPARIGDGSPVRSWCAEHLAVVTQGKS